MCLRIIVCLIDVYRSPSAARHAANINRRAFNVNRFLNTYTIAREALEKGKANGKSVAGYNIRWWDEQSKSCYLGDSDGVMYASYEDAESIGYRVAYLKSKGLLGAMIWEYREDDSSGTLRKALYDLMSE